MVRWASPDPLAALNRPPTARRGDGWCGVVRSGVAAMVLPFVMVHRCHRIASAGVVQLTGAGGRGNIVISYHTRDSDMVWLEWEIFRNIHSPSAAGQEQGLPLTGSYHGYRLGG
jgi:hypothetical protein